MEYGNEFIILSNNASLEHLKKVQNQALRIIREKYTTLELQSGIFQRFQI